MVIMLVLFVGVLGIVMEDMVCWWGLMVGGLLNVIFGNVMEFIFCMIVFFYNDVDLVEVFFIGLIIGNILLVLGFLVLMGGLCYSVLIFN